MSEHETPLGTWYRDNKETAEASLPGMVFAVLALFLAWELDGGAGFALALGIGGTVLGLWGVYLAVQANRDTKDIRGAIDQTDASVEAARTTVEELRTTAANLEESAQKERDVLDRLLAREELEILNRVYLALAQLHLTAGLPALSREEEPWPPMLLTRAERQKSFKNLSTTLRAATGFTLPAVTALTNQLFELRFGFGPDKRDPDKIDYRPLVRAAYEEIAPELAARRRTLRRT